jgi:hypothetical protein
VLTAKFHPTASGDCPTGFVLVLWGRDQLCTAAVTNLRSDDPDTSILYSLLVHHGTSLDAEGLLQLGITDGRPLDARLVAQWETADNMDRSDLLNGSLNKIQCLLTCKNG